MRITLIKQRIRTIFQLYNTIIIKLGYLKNIKLGKFS